MSRHVVAPRAQRDLVEIFDYIAPHNQRAARRMIERITARFKELAKQPLSGELRSDLSDKQPGIRSVSVGNYVIYFMPFDEGIEIVRVLHGAREVRSAMGF